MDNVFVAAGGSAIVVSTLLQALKNSALFPWLSRHTGKLNLLVSLMAAAVTAIGISYSFDFNPDSGAFAFGFKGTLMDVMHGVLHFVAQWCSQQAFYKGFIVPAEIQGEMRTMLARALTPPPVSEGDAKP